MWSGPRNISTALMRSFGNRADTFVTDEPLYAHYLAATRLPHPMRETILAHHDSDHRRVTAYLTGPIPDHRALWYQKHMAHHLLPDTWGPWLDELGHAFLIREPRAMLASLHAKLGTPRLEDTGLPQQVRLFHAERDRTGNAPPVVDARDVLTDPRRVLSALCDALDIPFDDAMLSWPPGRRTTDGIWAEHWYDAVERSTGFDPWRPRDTPLPDDVRDVLPACEDLYAELHAHRLT